MPPRTDIDVLIEGCAREPIHIPGKIQAHGCLLACDSGFTIRHASANAAQYLQHAAESLLGQPLFALIDGSHAREEWIAAVGDSRAAVYLGIGAVKTSGASFEITAHWRDDFFIVEFEPYRGESVATPSTVVSGFVTQLQQARAVPAICKLAVDEIRRITGFGRVLAYSFDNEGHGHVIAESIDEGYESYEGLRFPASDIPAQARELYRLNTIRVIPDAHYEPSALVTTADRTQPLDLSLSSLRSVSPVHLQYMINMGTLASMSVSILVEGRLWGLVSGHNLEPRHVAPSTRHACELLGKILSLQIEAREAHDETMRRLELRNTMVSMLAAMADRDSVSAGLCAIPETSLAFVSATGAAVIEGGRCHRIGDTPDDDELRELATWLNARSERDIYATDSLSQDFALDNGKTLAVSGLLAVSISEIHSNYILWFRPEVIKTVNWAGEPTKQQQIAAGVESLSPRTSFSMWQQILRGQSLSWSREELDAASTLRDSVRGIVLRKAEELAEMAEELRHANGELEAFSYSVSHDLRAPLRHIAGYAELLQEYEGETLSDRAVHYLDSIGESVHFAGTLVDELLAFSQMGRSALRLSNMDVGSMVEHIKRELAPDYENREIDWQIGSLPSISCDGAFIHLALRNLLANAIKYTRGVEKTRIEIGAEATPIENIVFVRDNGVGFDMQYVGKLFGVFQRLHSMDEFEGTGIGLANVRRIVERHGGRVWAEGDIGKGATFYFALPHVIPLKLKNAARPANADD